ncbi:phage tail tube protein [Providencia rettgeri]|uniref:phage tail tube protein n=1 Tax=Providencia rettgeri TaxID=587 RepID=UPI002361FFD1|nr:phage tail tube protein [Providencia rettgeri]
MAEYSIPNGSTVSVSSGYGEAIAITAASNASEVVLTVASAGDIKAGDVVIISDSWSNLNGPKRVKTVAASNITIEGFDSTDKSKYPAEEAMGTIKKVTGWTQIKRVTTVGIEGGDQQSTSIQFLEDDQAISLDTFKNPYIITYTLAYNADAKHHALLLGYDESKLLVAVRFYNKRAEQDRYYLASTSYKEIPDTAVNEIETTTVRFSLRSKQSVYAHAK